MIKAVYYFILILFVSYFASGFLISDQGTNVRLSNGSLLDYGNLTIDIYDSSAGGNVVFSSTIQDAIINGSWNLMINPDIQYGQIYWKDYGINGEDLDFDGNDRLQFQSSSGLINNVSFVNLSMINSCPSGSAIKLVYSNGSVECESVISGGVNLTDYALKNQSETFIGNITTTSTGFFGFLGSIANRITRLFVTDIDVSGNIDVDGNVSATYILGDGSLLTNLPSAGAESDPIFVAENSTLWSAVNSKLAQTDQRYNDTSLIISINRTSNIMSLGFYNITEINSLISGISGGNSSFNQSFTDGLYYSISNPLNFVNSSQISAYNETTLVLTSNSSLWSYINSNQASWNSTFNLTYNNLLGVQCPSGYFVNGTLSNGTLTCLSSMQSESDPLWTANSTSVLYIANLPLQNRTISHISNITGFSFNYNQTLPAIGYIDSLGFLTSSVANATYLLITDLPLANRTVIHCSNITGSVSNLCTLANNGATNIFNQILNTSSNVTFESVNATRELYVSNIAVKQWLYNQTTPALTYIDSVNSSIVSWTDSVFAKIINIFNRTEIQNQYYNRTDIDSRGYVNSSGLQSYNETLLINTINQTLSSLKLDVSDQRYNDTSMILSVNTTSNIMSLSFYNRSEVDSLISGIGNSSFNQSLTDVLYYSANNPLNFINSTFVFDYNDTNLVLNVNSTLWNYLNSNQASWNSTFNLTYNSILGQQCPVGRIVNGTLLNGTLSCIIDSNGSGNVFNQILNTTSNVTFGNVTVSSNSVFSGNLSVSTGFFAYLGSVLNRITKIFVVDLDVSNNLSVGGNISSQFYLGSLNRSTFPSSSCSGTDKVTGLNANGSISCGADESGSSSQTIPVKFMNVLAGAVTDTNAPATERIVGNSYYLVCTNATGYSNFRYGYARAATNGGANAIIYMKYIVDSATTITGSSYTNLSNSSAQILRYTAQNTANLSESYTMNNNLEDICIGAFQIGGDGVLDPQWRSIWIELS
ncbi:MAG: hypothetical protein AABX23_05210 [Nanoarchaeota archaeon]